MPRFALSLYLLLTLLMPARALADAAPDPLNKGIRPHRLSSKVQMTSERVDISLDNDLCKVTALFVFTNPTGITESMEVGFPSSYPAEIKNALVHVGGKRVSTRNSMDRENETIDVDGTLYRKHYDTHWLLWDMKFTAHQTRRVTISYEVEPADNADFVVTPYTKHRFAIKEEFEAHGRPITPEVKAVLDSIRSKTTGYVLQTGAGWDGPIGKAVILAAPSDAIRWASPQGNTGSQKGSMEWQLLNIEPDFDIFVEFNPTLSLEDERKQAKIASSRHPKSHALWEYTAFLTPVSNKTRHQFEALKAAFPNGIETSFTEYTDIIGQKNQKHMQMVLEKKPDLLNWLPKPMRETLFDGDDSNGEGVNYKLLKDGRIYIIMKINKPTLPDGQKAELWEFDYLFYGYMPIQGNSLELAKQALSDAPRSNQ